VRKPHAGFATTLVLTTLLAASCFDSGSKIRPLPEPEAAATPRLVRNLSELSASKITNPFEHSPAAPAKVSKAAAAATSETDDQSPRAFLDAPATVRRVGTDTTPGEQRLSNAKAAQFGNFSRVLLDRVFAAALELEAEDRMAKRKLPENLKPVVLTAIMNPEGRLQELIIEQHSGQAVVDSLFVEACRKGLWYNNPPKDAQTSSGNYQLRIEGRLRNFASQGADLWTFTTYLDLSIL
jgi:hypothetical protein